MNKVTVAICVLSFSVAHQSAASGINVVMHVETEMPCLKSELLSGTIEIRNNSDNDLVLLKGTECYPDMIVHEQVYMFPDIPDKRESGVLAGHGVPGGQPSRETIKRQVDSALQTSDGTIRLKKGEEIKIAFDNRELRASILSFTRERVPFAAELYMPPANWIPIEVRPAIAIACDAKVTPVRSSSKEHSKSPHLFRVSMETNEFLCVNARFSTHRLLEITPDDTVIFSNRTITVEQKSGDLRIIHEQDIPQVIDNRRHERQKRISVIP
jgi:hypothetical protein